jgi:hypothetical protein
VQLDERVSAPHPLTRIDRSQRLAVIAHHGRRRPIELRRRSAAADRIGHETCRASRLVIDRWAGARLHPSSPCPVAEDVARAAQLAPAVTRMSMTSPSISDGSAHGRYVPTVGTFLLGSVSRLPTRPVPIVQIPRRRARDRTRTRPSMRSRSEGSLLARFF